LLQKVTPVASLAERKSYRKKIMRARYEGTAGNRLVGITGTRLRDDLGIPDEDMAAACTYLESERLVTSDWTTGNPP
jgi:hypothetical protein